MKNWKLPPISEFSGEPCHVNMLVELRDRFRPVLATLVDDPEPALALIRFRGTTFADYQCDFCMKVAKQTGLTPMAVASYVVEHVDLSGLCHRPTFTGPNSLNLRLTNKK